MIIYSIRYDISFVLSNTSSFLRMCWLPSVTCTVFFNVSIHPLFDDPMVHALHTNGAPRFLARKISSAQNTVLEYW